MRKFQENQITDEYLGCPYCMSIVGVDQSGCCGEANTHFITLYEIKGEDGEYFTEEDIDFELEPSYLKIIEERNR